ncbi:unnamed protein product [Rotaria socialis]|uniref:Integrase catalytic domain-containing protein n=1 Tax=Rotaria socialis TaxID=392032 RepID=A0A818Y447_9BILA|nr:unnamed protein product [Rotaria socialis]
MQYPDFKLPNYLSHYNHIKNKLSIINNIIYFTKEPYPPVPLLPTNCIISMALRIYDKYSHCGRDKLVGWIRTIAYHIKLSELLNKICTACPICLLKKVHPLRHTPPTIKIQTTYPYELVVGDLLSMPNQGRYKYIFTVVDHYSKHLAVWPIKDKSSQTVADTLEKHILPTMLMCPKALLSDNGKEFQGKPFQDMLKKYNIKPLHSASYHCKSHRAIERINRTCQQLLRVNAEDTLDWPSILQHTVMCYNKSRHESLRTSPAEFLLRQSHEPNKKPNLTTQDTQYWRVGNPSFKSYKAGTLVMKITPRVGNRDYYKLQNLYTGPYVILNVHQGECDPVDERSFSRNWRPSDESCEVAADDLTNEFLGHQEVQDSVQNNEQESEEDEEEARESGSSDPPGEIIYTLTPMSFPSQIPQNPGLGVPFTQPITQPPTQPLITWTRRNISSPIVNNFQPPGQMQMHRSTPADFKTPPFVMPDLTKPPPPFTPAYKNNNFSPIQPIPQVYTHTPVFTSPPPVNHTPDIKTPPPYVPRQIFTPPLNNSVPFSPPKSSHHHTPPSSIVPKLPPVIQRNKLPDFSPALNELNKSPKGYQPPPQNYFSPNNNNNFNNNSTNLNNTPINDRTSYTPPYGDKKYIDLINENASPLKQPNFNFSPRKQEVPTNEGLSADQALSPKRELISDGENESSVQPIPELQPHTDERPQSRYRPSSPSIMKTRSQTRKENQS